MATFQIIGTVVLVACALGIFYGMFKMSRHDRKENDGNNHSKSKNTQHKALAAVLTFAALTAGQSAWATTKTVTYTITDINSANSSREVTFTRSGDTPFEGGNTTYTMYVNSSSLGNNPGNCSVMLADGFELSLHWTANNNVIFQDKCFKPASGNITYTVSCHNRYYYVTHLQMKGFEGPWNNTDYNSRWNFSQSYTTNYSFGEQDANLYIPQGNEEYAIVSVGNTGEMPINFKAKENGAYTISVNPEGVEMGYLHLIDNMTGVDVDLLVPNGGDAINRVSTYTFEAKTTDYESRFRLVFAADDASGDACEPGFVFISNGDIVITGTSADATLQIVDVTGRVTVCRDAVPASLSTSGMTPGVYVLRLIDGKDVKTQKIVIP